MNGRALVPTCRFGVAFILLLYFTSSLYGQNEKWELGVGLSPLNLRETPVSLLLRYNWSDRFALRVGLAGSYTETSEDYSYSHPYTDTAYRFAYQYLQVDKKWNASFLLGLQYGKRKSDFFWYGATDLYFRFSEENLDAPGGVLYPGYTRLPRGEIHIAFFGGNKSTIGVGVRQSVGVQYFINRFVSLSIEGGVFYEWLRVTSTFISYFSGQRDLPEDIFFGGSFRGPPEINENYALGVSPITFLIFNYHF